MFLAKRLLDEGNDVSMWIEDKSFQIQGKGMVPKVPTASSGLSKDVDLVIFDMVGMGQLADRLRKRGFTVLGGGTFNDRLELDRTFGIELMRKAGMATPKTKTFTDWGEAKDYVKKNENALVFKPHKNLPTHLTHVAEDNDEMVSMLDYFSSLIRGKPTFLIQDRIRGVEISHEIWFNGEAFVRPFNSTIERKRFLNDDLGPNIGCAHSLVWLWEEPNPKIFEMTISKIEPVLKHHQYIGPLDINTIVSEKDRRPYGLEWTARFGYSALQALIPLLDLDVGKLLLGVARGDLDEADFKSDLFGSALRVSVPPYPAPTEDTDIKGLPIEMAHILPTGQGFAPGDVFLEDNINFRVAGANGIVGEVVDFAPHVLDATKNTRKWAEEIQVPNKQYRTDIGELEETHLEQLKDWKYF